MPDWFSATRPLACGSSRREVRDTVQMWHLTVRGADGHGKVGITGIRNAQVVVLGFGLPPTINVGSKPAVPGRDYN